MSLVRLLFLCTFLGVPSAHIAGSAGSAGTAAAQDKQPVKEKEDPVQRKLRKVHEVLVSMRTREISERSMDVMLEAAGAPKEYAEKFKGQFDFDGMIDSTAEIYAKHLEEDEIDALLEFYKSEHGKKIATAMPDITIEAMKAGQEYGKRAAEGMGTGK